MGAGYRSGFGHTDGEKRKINSISKPKTTSISCTHISLPPFGEIN